MIVVGLRVITFSVLPLLLAAAHIRADRAARSRERKLETVLLYLFALGVAGSGIGGFFGHFFLPDEVARSIGWAAGSPFQLEVAFANLALGVLGIGAMGRRDGFREATVVAVTVFGLGATVMHVVDIVTSGNLAAGNILQNVSNVLKPALLIGFLAAARRTERGPARENATLTYSLWRSRTASIAGAATGVVSAGYGGGFALGQPVIGTLVGAVFAVGFVAAGSRGRGGRTWKRRKERSCESPPGRVERLLASLDRLRRTGPDAYAAAVGRLRDGLADDGDAT